MKDNKKKCTLSLKAECLAAAALESDHPANILLLLLLDRFTVEGLSQDALRTKCVCSVKVCLVNQCL